MRTPTVADADDLGSVHVRAWQSAYRGMMPDEFLDGLSIEERADQWRRGLANDPRPRHARFVAQLDSDTNDAVVGFVIVEPPRPDADAGDTADEAANTDVGEVYAIYVDPDHWGRGVGSDLITAGTHHLGAAGFTTAILWAHPDNRRARDFYVAHGWSDDNQLRHDVIFDLEVPETRYSRALP